MKFKPALLAASLLVPFMLAGCSAVASKTNTLSDERILSETSGVLGMSPSDLTLLERRTEGVEDPVHRVGVFTDVLLRQRRPGERDELRSLFLERDR